MTIGYHFTGDRLRDGRPLPAIGEWLVHDGPVQMCASGLHYSPTPWDALQYAPGPILHRVEVAEIVATDKEKGVCRRRRILQSGDATEMLRYFARMQALSVVHLWDAPEIVLDWLMSGDESIRAAAWAAAWEAERAAAGAAAWAAAGDAFNALVMECLDHDRHRRSDRPRGRYMTTTCGMPRKAKTQQNCEAWYYRMPNRVAIFVRDLPNGPTRVVEITKRQAMQWLRQVDHDKR